VLTAMIDSGEGWNSVPVGPVSSPYDLYDPLYPGYMGPYGSPYVVYRNPGLIGRFYSYYPLSRGSGYWNNPYQDNNPYNNDANPVNPGTGQPVNPDRDRLSPPERRQ
jgi:hypothetical protein